MAGRDLRPEASFGEFPFTLPATELTARGAAHLAEVSRRLEALLAAREAPTVAGFLAPLDAILSDAYDLSAHGSFAFQVHPSAETRRAGRELSESADRFFNQFRIDRRVYDRLRQVPLGESDGPTKFAVEKMLRDMRRAGVEQDEAGRSRLLQLQNRIDELSNQFNENIAAGEHDVAFSPDELRGLPDDFLASHAPGADGKVRVTTRNPDYRPVMAYAESGDVRRRLLREFLNRAHPSNLTILDEILAARHALARALGYPTYAAYALEDKMLANPAAAREFLAAVTKVLRGPAEAEVARFLARKRKDEPDAATIELWDIGALGEGFYDGKIRREEFGVDSKKLREYLPYGAVRDGLFTLCHELFDLEFRRTRPEGVWHETVEAYDVLRSGAPLGRIFLDLVPREGKFTHAACFGVRVGTAPRALPQSALVCNFLDPGTPAETARMQYSDVVTFFHEFGHLLHALFSGHGPWLYDTMSFVEWDFIEAPSLLFEEWARDPATLGRFARDPTTGARMPEELLRQVAASEGLGRAAAWLRQVALSAASLGYYDRDPKGIDTTAEYVRTFHEYWPIPFRDEYHPQEGWGHLTGYSAFYYTYVWSLTIARDLLKPFLDAGTLTDRTLAERYAREILMPGSVRPARDLVQAYLGRPNSLEAFRGWIEDGTRRGGRPAPNPAAR